MKWNSVLSHRLKCRLSKLMWIQRSMHSPSDVSVRRAAMHWESLALIHHRPHIILLLMALASGQSICFSDLWQATECWMEVYSAAVPACVSLIYLLIIIPPNNLAPDTFDNIMWNRSEDSANETEWWMLLSTALTLLIVVTGSTFTHTLLWPCRAAGVAIKIKSRAFIEVVQRHVGGKEKYN